MKFSNNKSKEELCVLFDKLSNEGQVRLLKQAREGVRFEFEQAAIGIEKAHRKLEMASLIEQKPQWSERTTGREVSPADFIKANYGRWIDDKWEPNGLTRADLMHDRPLYYAYATYLQRHPEADLHLPTEERVKVTDADASWERRKALDRLRKRRPRQSGLDAADDNMP